MKDLIIFGAGGFGREVAWAVERINNNSPTWNLIGFIDDAEDIQGTEINGYPVLGKTDDIGKYTDAYYVVAVGASIIREKVVNNMKEVNPDIRFGTVIDPSVEMSSLVTIGEGTIICAHTIITVNIDIGSGMVTIALASLLIGNAFMGKGSITKRAIGVVIGAFVFRLVYTVALRFNMPAFMLKLVSSVIVIIAISGPYLKKQFPLLARRMALRKGKEAK